MPVLFAKNHNSLKFGVWEKVDIFQDSYLDFQRTWLSSKNRVNIVTLSPQQKIG